MGFSIADYAKKKGLAGGQTPSAPSKSGGFSVADYAKKKQKQTGLDTLNNFSNTVNTIYGEINSVLGNPNAKDEDVKKARSSAHKLLDTVGEINTFLDNHGSEYDNNAVLEIRKVLSEVNKATRNWIDDSNSAGYLETLRNAGEIDPSAVAKAVKDKESEIARAQRGGRDTSGLEAELDAIYESGGSYGQAAKRRREYAANKALLEQKKAEAAELGTRIGLAENVDEETEKRVQILYDEIRSLQEAVELYERVSAYSDDIWYEVFNSEDLSEYRFNEYAPQDDPLAHIAATHPEVFGANANVQTADGKKGDTSNLLTEEERVIYNYLLKNNGRKAAKEWLDSYYTSETRNQRVGAAAGEKYNEIDSRFLRTLASIPLSLRTGLEQFQTGISSTLSREPKAAGVYAYEQQEATKDLGFVGKAVNDAAVSIGNMAPSIAIGAINPVAGQVSFGVSAAGNAYNEARKEGKSKGEAALYGIVSGTSEVMLQNLLGGIPGISGGANKLVTAARNLKSPVLRALSVYGINAFGEGTEEYIQDILDPVFRNIAFREDNEIKLYTDEAAYSFALGLLTAGVMNAPGLVTDIKPSVFGRSVNESGHTQNLIDNALKLPEGSKAYEIAVKLNNGELKQTNENVGDLSVAYARAGGDLSFLEKASGSVETMAKNGDMVTATVEAASDTAEAQRIVDDLIADGEITNSKAERIIDNAEALEIIGASTEGLETKSQKRAAVKEALRTYRDNLASEEGVAQRIANEVAQSTENIVADARRARAEQTDGQTASEGSAANADTFRYHYNVDKQKLGTRLIKELGNIKSNNGGTRLADKLVDIATSVTGDSDANRAVYKMFENPRYAMSAAVEHTDDVLEIIKNFKTAESGNFARGRMSGYVASTAAIAEWTDLMRKDGNGVTLDNAAAMAPAKGKKAPEGYFDESERAVVLNDGMVTYRRIIATLVHEGFHADGSIDRALVDHFSEYLEDKWGKEDWEANVDAKKAKIEAYTGKPTTVVKAEEEVCAEVLTKMFNMPSAWEAMGEMFGEVEGSERLINRMKAATKRIFDNFRKKFGGEIPGGKLTTFRDHLDTLLTKTFEGYTSVNEAAEENAPSKKTKAEKKSKSETKAEPEVVEEIDLDEELDEDFDEEFDDGLTDEERGAVDLASDYLEGEIKNTAEGGRLYSSEDTEVDLPDNGSHMLSETAEAEVKKALADKFYRKEIRLTNRTPSIMLSRKDVKNYPLFMNASHLRENVFTEGEARQKGLKINRKTHYHGLGDKLFLEVIDKLDDITEAYRGTKNAEKPERRENYFLLISKLKDKNGSTINVPIYINTKAKHNNVFIDVNKTATVFGKRNINHYIAQELRKGNIVRIKKRSPQTSEWTPPIGADYGMDASSVNRIADFAENVNTPDENSKKSYSSPDTDILSGVESPSVSEDISVLENAESESGGRLYNYKAMEADEEEYRRMLKTHGKLADNEIDELFDTVDAVVDRIKETIESDAELARAIDYAWDKDIDDRAYNPLKQNSDKLYKVSLDFSTMCRKRILQQITQSQIQEAMDKTLDANESIAVRQALAKLIDLGFEIEVACKLCYVESARLKSPAQIKKFLANKEQVLIEFLGGRSAKIAVKEAEAAVREKLGVGKTPLKDLPKDVADEIREAKRKVRRKYQPTEGEAELVETIRALKRKDFTTPEGLENLAKNHYEIFNAYTSYIRNATKSKAVENDTWFRAGDTAAVGDALVSQMNAENGLRSQSWSDFQVIHLLDYIAATIELSTRNAKEQVYTKVPDFVKLMHATNAMINLSLIPAKEYNGKLEYDGIEGMPIKTALKLREAYPDVAGTICIGITPEQTKKLLESTDIDYVIPYHSSALNKHLRKAMDIPTWEDFQNYQGEKALSDADAEANAKRWGVTLNRKNWHKAPAFSEWFDLAEAKRVAKSAKHGKYGVMTGAYLAMQNAADNYKRICAERGLAPKFSYGKGDFVSEENYWKLLIDRKMINQITGDIIDQKALTPKFNLDEISEIMDDAIAQYPTVKKHQNAATEIVTKLFMSGKVRGDMSAAEIYSAVETALREETDNTTVFSILEGAKELDGRMFSSEDTDVNTSETPLATVNDFNAEVNRIYRDGKAAGKTDEEIGKEVEEAARARNDGAGAMFGFIEPGENPVREVRVPKQTSKDDKVSLTARTAEEAGSTPEEVLPTIDSMIANGTFSYKPLKNKELKAKCKERIGSTRDSYREALRSWERKDKLVSAEDIAMGWMLYDEALKQNEQSVALDILVRISTEVRTHAQAVQANRILKTLSPAGKMDVARRTAERLTEKLKEEGKVPRKRYTDEERATVEDARKYGKRYADGRISKTFSKLGLGDNVPVEEWAKEIGNDVAAAISKRMAPLNPKEMLVSRTVANDLVQFAENYALPKKQTSNKNRSAAERVADFFANRDQYVEAWNQAREVLREQYKDRPDKLDLLEAFLNGTIDYNGEGSDALMMRAVAEAALNNDVKMRDIMSRAELGDIKAVMDEIYSRLQETVKAEGSDAKLLRDAVQRWVTEKYVQFHPLTQKQIDAVIRKKMRELGKSVDYIIRQDRTEKGDMLQQITAMLVNEFGVSREGAASAAVKIKEHYDAILEKASRAAFERATKERKPVDRKSLDELFANYANMGAFTSDYNKALTEKLFKQEGIEVNKRLAEDYLAAETDEGRDKALEAIYKDIGSQIPSTFADKERAWRYLSMLGNLRTHVRNVFGNAKFALDVITKDAVATMIEAGYAKTHDIERTKAFLNPIKDKALIEAAHKDTAVVHDMLVYGEKYNDQATNAAIDEGRVIFEGKVGKYVEWLRKKNTWLLEKEDAIFLNAHYTYALAQYCKANGITAKQIENGEIPDAARAYAIKEAKKATFRDENIFSNAFSRMRFRGDDPVSKSLNFLVDGVFPFRKTPANILVRGVEYSPFGLTKGLYDMATKVRKGEMSAAEAIDEIASGLTGTALLALGYFFTALGFIRATGDEDEEKFDELMGHQAYALEIGNFSMTLDWLAPSAIPFFVGAEIAELKKLQGDVKMADIASSLGNIAEPMLELSCLQSFNDWLDSLSYSDNKLFAGIAGAATSRLTQYIPTLFGQIERTFENKRMTTYTDKDSFLDSDTQYLLGKISAKLPGVDYQQIPYIDAWGRIEDTGPWWARPRNNFINPAYLSNITTSAMETELQRLKDATGKTGVYPSRAAKKITVSKKVNGKRESEEYNLSAEEYVQYATSKGNIAYNAITAFMDGTVYKTLNDTERADAIGKIYSYADQYARTVITDHVPEGWIAEAIEAQQKGMSFDTFFEAYVAQSSITADRDFLGNVISGTAADKKKEIIDGITTDTYERDMLYDYLGVGKTAQNDGIIASIIDAALRKDTEAYDKATQDYLKRNEGATRGDLTEAKSKYLAAEQERLAKLYYDDKSEYERQVAKYRDGKDRAIASKFNSKSMEAARTRWKNEYTEELAEKLAKYANDSEKVKLIYAEAAKYGIDSTKLEARAKVYARKK